MIGGASREQINLGFGGVRSKKRRRRGGWQGPDTQTHSQPWNEKESKVYTIKNTKNPREKKHKEKWDKLS